MQSTRKGRGFDPGIVTGPSVLLLRIPRLLLLSNIRHRFPRKYRSSGTCSPGVHIPLMTNFLIHLESLVNNARCLRRTRPGPHP